MAARKPAEAKTETVETVETVESEGAQPTPPKLLAIRNNYFAPLQIGDGTIIPAGDSIPVDDVAELRKNATVAAWLDAGMLEIID